jgi:hypothetical protein
MAFADQIMSAGSIGLTSRPRPRYIDKILMRQRDEKAQAAHQMNPGQQMASTAPGNNPFGGPAPFNRPNTLAMMLGGGQ